MRRLARIASSVAVLASLAACSGALPGRPSSYQPIAGVAVDEHWRFLTQDAERQVYIQTIPIEEPGRTAAYVRYEERRNQGTADEPMMSARSVFEFNCRTGQFRTVNTTFYAARNLKQSYPPVDAPPKAWVRPEPNSIASKAYAASCRTQVADQEPAPGVQNR